MPLHDPLIHEYLATPGDHTLIGFACYMREQLANEILALQERATQMPPFSAMGYLGATQDAAHLVLGSATASRQEQREP